MCSDGVSISQILPAQFLFGDCNSEKRFDHLSVWLALKGRQGMSTLVTLS